MHAHGDVDDAGLSAIVAQAVPGAAAGRERCPGCVQAGRCGAGPGLRLARRRADACRARRALARAPRARPRGAGLRRPPAAVRSGRRRAGACRAPSRAAARQLLRQAQRDADGARHLGLAVEGYARPEHGLQRAIAAIVGEVAGLDSLPEPGTDGCSAPIWPMPLKALATATARLARPEGQPAGRAAALGRIAAAMRQHPELVAGTGRCCTALMGALPEVTVKTGAEGVFIAALHGPGLGLALKTEDGAGRAAEVALLACLEALIEVPTAARLALAAFAQPVIRTRAGVPVGRIAPAAGLSAVRPRMTSPAGVAVLQSLVAGIDEVGRGPLAGPVVAAAVILGPPIEGIANSKVLTPARRQALGNADSRVGQGGHRRRLGDRDRPRQHPAGDLSGHAPSRQAARGGADAAARRWRPGAGVRHRHRCAWSAAMPWSRRSAPRRSSPRWLATR